MQSPLKPITSEKNKKKIKTNNFKIWGRKEIIMGQDIASVGKGTCYQVL